MGTQGVRMCWCAAVLRLLSPQFRLCGGCGRAIVCGPFGGRAWSARGRSPNLGVKPLLAKLK